MLSVIIYYIEFSSWIHHDGYVESLLQNKHERTNFLRKTIHSCGAEGIILYLTTLYDIINMLNVQTNRIGDVINNPIRYI